MISEDDEMCIKRNIESKFISYVMLSSDEMIKKFAFLAMQTKYIFTISRFCSKQDIKRMIRVFEELNIYFKITKSGGREKLKFYIKKYKQEVKPVLFEPEKLVL